MSNYPHGLLNIRQLLIDCQVFQGKRDWFWKKLRAFAGMLYNPPVSIFLQEKFMEQFYDSLSAGWRMAYPVNPIH
jgi:hypothetical protein